MVRISLIAAAAFVTIVSASPVLAQATAPVRSLKLSAAVDTATIISVERKTAPCADRGCVAKALKRAYVGAAPLGW